VAATRTEKEAYTPGSPCRLRGLPAHTRRLARSLEAKNPEAHADRAGGRHAWVALPLTRPTSPHSLEAKKQLGYAEKAVNTKKKKSGRQAHREGGLAAYAAYQPTLGRSEKQLGYAEKAVNTMKKSGRQAHREGGLAAYAAYRSFEGPLIPSSKTYFLQAKVSVSKRRFEHAQRRKPAPFHI